ncbi:stage II sporulation protein D [Paenibacillus sp. NPDC058071]|uniref:stage II sporulation protein D n=1 Tax=Paenibacillus sp. NPDC058071 TaxID=3346326 RepID=UPI0036D8C49F
MKRGKRTSGQRFQWKNPQALRWWSLFMIGGMIGLSVAGYRLSAMKLADRIEQRQETAMQQAAAEREAGERDDVSTRDRDDSPVSSETEEVVVRVYLTKEKRIERVPLETYVKGVVAAEMPLEFELEALKAQAIAARTYIVRRLDAHDVSGLPEQAAGRADATDTVAHQVYLPFSEWRKQLPKEKRKVYEAKLDAAVTETKGRVITYRGEPIQAVFFSTSNGYTENSEDYFNQSIPYLRSVSSPWDKQLSPRYKETVVFGLDEFYDKLGIEHSGKKKPAIRVVKLTEGKRIGMIAVGTKKMTGREAREKLGLASSQFSWTIQDDSIAITTFGYGHGVGMSQWGANGMAKSGASAEDIISHYYSGTSIEQASKLSDGAKAVRS